MKAVLILICVVLTNQLNLIQSIIVNCEYQIDYIINKTEKYYSCKVAKFEDDDSNFTVIGNHAYNFINQENFTRKNNSEVLQILGRSKTIEKFPGELGKIFENLKIVRFSSCNMVFLEKDHFAHMSKLEYLDLIGNKIEYLKSDTFKYASNLNQVILNNNRIEFIGENLLRPLKNIAKISFGGNICTSGSAENSVEDLARLNEEIAMKCSDITKAQMIMKLSNLETQISQLSNMKCNDFTESRLMTKITNLETENAKMSHLEHLNQEISAKFGDVTKSFMSKFSDLELKIEKLSLVLLKAIESEIVQKNVKKSLKENIKEIYDV